jgi:hypothetical protein
VDRDREFTEFVVVQRAALVRVAALLVSGDLARAEDVVQTALTRLYLAWPRVRAGTAGAYARRWRFRPLNIAKIVPPGDYAGLAF